MRAKGATHPLRRARKYKYYAHLGDTIMHCRNIGAALAACALAFAATEASAASVIADWTFETSLPATSGPFAAEIGTGQASGSHAGAAVYSTPAGNGSSHSFSSNTWAVNDYYQFRVSTTGFTGITISWDQTSSSTGPRDFALQYSTNGTTFTTLTNYSVLVNAAPNAPWTAGTYNSAYTFNSSVGSFANNQASLYFRLTDVSTVAANGGAVATAGTDRVDNVLISGTAATVPLPASIWLLASGALALLSQRRRFA